MGGSCSFCGFGLYNPVVANLSVTQLGLYDDARFPGRAILMYRDHVEDLAQLAPEALLLFWQDAIRVAEVIKRVTGSPRINYAVLGNAEPHLHIHLIPRYPDHESAPNGSPWNDPRPLQAMDSTELDALRTALEAALA